MRNISILIFLFAFSAQAMLIPAKPIIPDDLFVPGPTESNFCNILWRYPFAEGVLLKDRIRVMDYCDMLENLPAEVRERVLQKLQEQQPE